MRGSAGRASWKKRLAFRSMPRGAATETWTAREPRRGGPRRGFRTLPRVPLCARTCRRPEHLLETGGGPETSNAVVGCSGKRPHRDLAVEHPARTPRRRRTRWPSADTGRAGIRTLRYVASSPSRQASARRTETASAHPETERRRTPTSSPIHHPELGGPASARAPRSRRSGASRLGKGDERSPRSAGVRCRNRTDAPDLRTGTTPSPRRRRAQSRGNRSDHD